MLKPCLEERFLSPYVTKSMKGVLAAMVLLSHLHGRVGLFSSSILGTVFTAFGYLAVGAFFFLSGYGLYTSMERKKGYLQHFISQKLLPFYAVYLCLCALYALATLIETGSVSGRKLLMSVLFGNTIVVSGWYLQAQMLLYLVFYLAFRFANNGVLWTFLATILYCVVCPLVGLSSTWYETVPCFVLGLLAAKNRAIILEKLKTKSWVILGGILNLGVFLISMLLGNKNVMPEILRIPLKMLSAYSFVMLVVILVTFVKTENPVLAFLGSHSLELYTLQGIFLGWLRTVISNDWLYMLVVVLALLAAAVAAKPLFTLINKSTAKLCLKMSKKGQ